MKKRLQTLKRLTIAGIALLIFSFGLLLSQAQAQTVLISPTGDGGFENGATFGANGWTLSNSTNNPWVLGTADGYSSTPMSNRTAFIRDTGSTVAYYDNTKNSLNYFYRDITVPAGQSKITLTFNWMLNGEGNWDMWQVFVSDTIIVPTGTTTYPGSGTALIPAGITGATYVGNGAPSTGVQNATYILPGSLAGTTFRLIFAFKGDNSGGSQPPSIIDNISLVSEIPVITTAGGVFTINNLLPTGGTNFNNFTDAILNTNVLGSSTLINPLIFNVSAGQIFNENPPELTSSGNAANRIIFRKSGSGANPIVSSTGTATANEAAISIGGGDYITFDGIDVSSSNALLEFGYRMRTLVGTNGCIFNTITNARVTLNNTLTTSIGIVITSSTSSGGATVSATSGQMENNTISNMIIENCGLGGVFLISGNSSFPGQSNRVINTTIGAAYTGTPTGDIGGSTTASSYGITAQSQNNFEASNCTIRNIMSSGIKRGILTTNSTGLTNIFNNRVFGISNNLTTSTSSTRGIDVSQSTVTGPTNITNVYNNEISDLTAAYSGSATATRLLMGMFIGTGNATSEINIYNNTVVLDGSGSLTASNVCLEWGGSTATYNVRNNHFINNTGAQTGLAKHYVLRTSSGTLMGSATSIINNNNYFLSSTTNGFMGLLNATDAATIAAVDLAITTPASNDANTVSINPLFVNAAGRDFRSQVKALDNTGAALAVVTTDINGNPRSSTPDIGATEISIGAPVLVTNNAGNVTQSAANLNASITSSFPAVSASGILIGTSNALTLGAAGVTDIATSPMVGLGAFNLNATGLTTSTTYFYRAYARNSTDTGYGAVRSFSTSTTIPFVENFDVSFNANANGWNHTRFFYTGNGNPTALNTVGPKDWITNRNTGAGLWTSQGLSTNPNNAVSDSGALWIEDYYYATTNGGSNLNYSRIETPGMDLSASSNPYVRFYYFHNQSANYTYPLILMASSDNGLTWKSIMRIQPNAAVNTTATTGSGTMTSATPWQRIAVKVPDAYKTANTKFAFYRNSAYSFGGNIFIDSLFINEYTPTTITSSQTGVWSNPTTWVGGVVPNADNHVEIATGHTVTSDVNMARMQNLTVNGTFIFLSSSTLQTAQIFGNLNINSGATFNAGTTLSSAVGRFVYIGEGLNNAGTLNMGTASTHSLLFVGGISSTISHTGTITNNYISQVHFANSGGITFNPSNTSNVVIRNVVNLVDGPVNPNGKLTVGFASPAAAISILRGGPEAFFTSRPLYPNLGTLARNVTFGGGVNGNFQMAVLSRDTIFPGNETDSLAGGINFIRGTMQLFTNHHVKLNRPLQVGDTLNRTTLTSATTGVGGSTLFSRGILFTDANNILTIGPSGLGSAGAIASLSTVTPPVANGSHIVGPLRFVRPIAGSLTGTISIPFGLGTNYLGAAVLDNVRRYATVTAGAGWAGQILECESLPIQASVVNAPQSSLIGRNIFRIQPLENRVLPATSTVLLSTYDEIGKSNRDILYGTQDQLFVMQSVAANGPWNVRSLTLGTGAFVQNALYTRTTSATAPGPISGNGNFYAFGTSASIMQYVDGDVIRNTNPVAAGTSNMQMLRVRVNSVGVIPINVTSINLNTTGTTNASSISNAKVYYTGLDSNFNTNTQVGSTVISPNGNFNIPVSQSMLNGNNFFWVTYDVASSATVGQVLVANLAGIVVADTLRTPASNPSTGGRTVSVPMTFVSANAFHGNLSKVEQNSINNEILRLEVVMSATGAGIAANSFTFNTNGSATPTTNILNAKVYYTGASPFLNTNQLFGTFSGPNGAFTINGNVNVLNGMNYFWLVYDVPTGAIINDSVDAEFTNVTINNISNPTVISAPAGARLIRAPYCASGATVAGDSDIGRVIFSSGGNPVMNVGTGCGTAQPWATGTYTNNTGIGGINLITGATVNFDICYASSGTAYTSGMAIYIDYNQNGVWDAGEMAYSAPTLLSTNFVGSFSIPCTALNGPTRMRIVLIESTILALSNSCGTFAYGETEDYTVNIVNAPPTFLATNALQQVSQVGAGATNVPILRVPVKVISTLCVPGTIEQLNFNTAGTTSVGDILAAKLYRTGINAPFSTTNLVGTVSTPSGAFSFPLTDTTFNDTNNYWLAYDVSSSAANSNLLDARFDSALVFGSWRTPINANPTGAVTVTVPMTYLSSDVIHPTIAKVERGTANNQFLRIMVRTSSTGAPIALTQFSLSTNGSANPLTNMDSAIIWYTGSNPNFATTNFFGGVGAQSGAFNITGLQNLGNDTNYFWLTYRLPATAAIGDSLDAELTSITIAGTPQTPTTTAPAGSRQIRAPYCISAATSAFDSDIGRVIFTSGGSPVMNVGTGCGVTQPWATGTYTNNTGITGINLIAGGTINFDICYASSGAAYTSGMAIYIDINQNGLWDAGEMVYTAPALSSGNFIGSFTVPCSALNGPTRMRVVLQESVLLTLASSCGTYFYGETEDYTVNIVQQPASYLASTTIQQVSTTSAGTVNIPVLRVPLIARATPCLPGIISQLNFNTIGTTNTSDIVSAKLYKTGNSNTFNTNNLVGTVTSPNGAFFFTVSDTAVNDTNNYWLAYDISTTATNANVVDARFDSAEIFGAWRTPAVSTPAGNVTITVPMTYLSSNMIHPTLTKVERGSTLNQMARIMVVASSTGATIPVTQFSLNTNGSANPATNIDSIMVWSTGANPNLVSPVFYGGTGSGAAPFNITGSRNLLNDTNYFWVTYNIKATATVGDSVDVELTSITVGGTPQTPTTTAPAGARLIRAPYCPSSAAVPLADGEIWNVTLGTLNNTSSCTTTGGVGSTQGGYSNFTSTVAAPNLMAGSVTPFSVNTSTCGGPYDGVLGMWIDFNDDGDFTDLGEEVHMTLPFLYGTAVFRTGNITIPLNVAPGLKRMRVILNETTFSPISPCAAYGYGETEDYTVNILPAPIPTTYVWNQTAPNDFTTATNWTPNRNNRNLNDRLAFNANATVNNVSSQEVATITVSNNAVVTLDAAAAENLAAWDTLNIASGRIIGGANLTLTVGNRTNIGTITGAGGVQGTLARWVDTAAATVTFPLVQGTASRRVTMTTSVAPVSRGTVIARFVPGIPTTAGIPFLDGFLPVNKVSENGVWRIESGNGFNPGANGSYNLALQADAFTGVLNLSSITVIRRATATANWDTAGVYSATTGTTSSFIANRSDLRVFGEFAVASDSAVNPLPVKLISFNASGVNNDVLLTWKTAMELNNKGFMVERSIDGKKFESVQFVKGNGTTAQISNYLLLDEKAFNIANTLFYRLRQIDFDETVSYSNVVKVERNDLSLSNVVAVPNPFVGTTQIEFVSAATSPYVISIVDVQGKEIVTRTVNVKEGMNSILLPELEGVNAGIYFINVNGVESRTLKVVKTAN